MGRAWNSSDDDLVGVVGREDVAATIGEDVVAGDVETVLERAPAIVVCVGESALTAVARAGASVPVLPVDVETGPWSTTTDQLLAALEAIRTGRFAERDHPVLTVDADDLEGPTRALFDVTLVTAEPARISEYSVASRGDSIAQFRADGVVVATPQGSHGYAGAAGGPLVSNGLDAVAVVPVAPFVTQTRQWILPDDGLELAVERDEGAVALQVDDRVRGTVDVDTTITVGTGGQLRVLLPEGRQSD